MEILWLEHRGFDHDTIACLADCSRCTAQRTLEQYVRGGLELLRRAQPKQSRGEPDDPRVPLEDVFAQQPRAASGRLSTSSRNTPASVVA